MKKSLLMIFEAGLYLIINISLAKQLQAQPGLPGDPAQGDIPSATLFVVLIFSAGYLFYQSKKREKR